MDEERELERLQRDLSAIAARWAEPGYFERTSALIADQERQTHHELHAAIADLEARIAARPRPAPVGGLRSPMLGTWSPLALHESPLSEAERPPPLAVEPPAPTAAAGELRSELFDLLVPGGDRAWKNARAVGALVARWRHEPALRALLAGALLSVGKPTAAHALHRSPEKRPPRPWRHAPTQWLECGEELPDEFTGLTATQRAILEGLREIAPGPGLLTLKDILTELRARAPAIPAARVERELLALGHPSLRPVPLVEFKGLTGRFNPPNTFFTHARISRAGHELLMGTLALPMLLVNGAEGIGTSAPAHDPSRCIAAVRFYLDDPEILDAFPLNALDRVWYADRAQPWSSPHSLWKIGSGRLAARCRLQLEVDKDRREARIVVVGFPWPLRAAAVKQRIEEAVVAGEVFGVTAVFDVSSADRQKVIVELDHLAFATGFRGWFGHSEAGLVVFEHALRAHDPRARAGKRLTVPEHLRAFIEHLKELAVKRLDERLASSAREAARAEAVCLALELLEPVQATIRAADDDDSAARALTMFMTPAHRAALSRLAYPPSHSYETGFTLDQAKYLSKLKKLGGRHPEVARSEWSSRLAAWEAAKAALSSRTAVMQVVREDLAAAFERYSAPSDV